MTYSVNGIFDYVKRSILASHSEAYVTSRREPIPRAFPCVEIRQFNKNRQINAVTLDMKDRQYITIFEVQIFSNSQNSALSEAYALEETVETAFNNLGYRVTFCQPIDNIDPSIFRIIARFERVIGMGDILPDYPSN